MKPRRRMAEAKILVAVPQNLLQIISKALQPELESFYSDRSKVFIEASEKGLVVQILAEDVTALRAAINSYLYWIYGIIDIGSRINS